jgi:vacuolar-type H+-ATPase subunit H
MPRRGDEDAHSANGEAEVLARLREHEHELDHRLEEAQREAEALLAEAGREAESLKESARAELSEAVERLRQEQAREVAQALAAIQEETRRRGQALRHQAALNREQALAWLVSRVTGRDRP